MLALLKMIILLLNKYICIMCEHTQKHAAYKLETMMIKVISKDKLCERKILLFMLLNLNCNLLFIIYFSEIQYFFSFSMNAKRDKKEHVA